ncbi:hypothetical protein J6590_050603 [Homalodisca vitripennis]|nr:hypothetical protein J6590_050603 [Homalodisca vitripennis]
MMLKIIFIGRRGHRNSCIDDVMARYSLAFMVAVECHQPCTVSTLPLEHGAHCDRPGLLHSVKMHTIKWTPDHYDRSQWAPYLILFDETNGCRSASCL